MECGVRGLQPDSVIGAYLPNIINGFIMRGWDTDNIKKACSGQRFRFFKRGFEKMFDKKNPKCSRAKVAFTLYMALETVKTLEVKGMYGSRYRQAIKLAMLIGIFFLLRKSEYLESNSKSKKGIRFSDITFFTRDGKKIPWDFIGKVSANSVHLSVLFSKTDQHGYGRMLQHVRQEGEICVVKELEKWFNESRDIYSLDQDSYVLALDVKNSKVDDKLITSVMKFGAISLGLNPDKVSAHSLRYGGATMLAAAGLPQYLIAWYGGWSSDSTTMRLYANLGQDAVNMVSSVMCKQSMSGISDQLIKQVVRNKQPNK